MRRLNKLVILTVPLNFFILFGAGHGIGFMGLLEWFGPIEFLKGNTKFRLTGDYDERLFASAMLAAVGQVFLLIGCVKKRALSKLALIYAGIIVLFFSFVLLIVGFFNSSLNRFSFWSGTPFLVACTVLLIRTVQQHRRVISKSRYGSQHEYLQ